MTLTTTTTNTSNQSTNGSSTNGGYNASKQNDFVAINFVPFGEKALLIVTNLYEETASHASVIENFILKSIIQVGSRDYKSSPNNKFPSYKIKKICQINNIVKYFFEEIMKLVSCQSAVEHQRPKSTYIYIFIVTWPL